MEEAASKHRSLGASWAVLDGRPRNVEQAQRMRSIGWDVRIAIFLDVPEDTAFSRVDGRLIHPASGRTYHPSFRPPRDHMKDDLTGEPLEERKLDKSKTNKEAFKSRMDVEFRQNVVPLI